MSRLKGQSKQDGPVAKATRRALQRIDHFIQGGNLTAPDATYLTASDELIGTRSASVVTGILFFLFYWLEEPGWKLETIPIGWRSAEHGDKFLCEELTKRQITLHGRIKAYGENVGSKGGQAEFRPLSDARYGPFLKAVAGAPVEQRTLIADYLAQRFAESRRTPTALPPVGADVLTFVRAKDLFQRLINTPSGGAIPQFLIAALLFVYRRRSGIRVVTHQVHASDTSDRVAGDVEEHKDGRLHRAYEVTVRTEWKARMSGFRAKMDQFGLSKYIIIAGGLNSDEEWSTPAKLALKIEPYGRDVAVIDIFDVVNFLATELTADELREAVNKGFDYLNDPGLCGRPAYIDRYREVVHDWLTAPGVVSRGMEHGTEAQGEVGERPVRGPDFGQLQEDEGDQGEGK